MSYARHVSKDNTPYEDVVDQLQDSGHPVEKGGFQLPRLRMKSISHRGMDLRALRVATGSAVATFGPDYISYPPLHLLLGANGYMQPPTGFLTDKFLIPAQEFMKKYLVHGAGYAHGRRGTAEVMTRQGRYSVGHIQDDVAEDTKAIIEWLQIRAVRPVPTVLMGHSQGGQHVAHQLADPEKYGLKRDQIRGVVLINSMLLPHSQQMLLTPGFFKEIALSSLGRVAGSMITGKGLLFRGQKAFDAFVGEGDPNGKNERRITEGTYPDSGMFFTQTVTTGTSPSLKDARLKGLPVSIIVSEDDQLMGKNLQYKTADYLDSFGADVRIMDVPGKHLSPLMTHTGESPERVELIMDQHRQALAHAFQNLR